MRIPFLRPKPFNKIGLIPEQVHPCILGLNPGIYQGTFKPAPFPETSRQIFDIHRVLWRPDCQHFQVYSMVDQTHCIVKQRPGATIVKRKGNFMA
jgi:hypothetical protein